MPTPCARTIPCSIRIKGGFQYVEKQFAQAKLLADTSASLNLHFGFRHPIARTSIRPAPRGGPPRRARHMICIIAIGPSLSFLFKDFKDKDFKDFKDFKDYTNEYLNLKMSKVSQIQRLSICIFECKEFKGFTYFND